MNQSPRQYHTHTLSVIACGHPKDPKRPLGPWAEAQRTITIPDESTHYGIVCGAVSNHLECIDYDRKHDPSGDTYSAFRDIIQATHPFLWERLLLERSVNGGVHIIYRCPEIPIPGNAKLSSVEPPQAVFETRGEGGYYICAPSPGYELIQGAYDNIPILTAEERNLLIDAAKSFDVRPPADDPREQASHLQTSHQLGYTGLSPLDDYDERADTLALLKRHGWKVAYTSNGTTYLTRPGKRMGISATWNHIPNRFYVFTSSTAFEPNRAYKPCAVLAYLEHNADFTRTAQALIKDGFGKKSDGVIRPLPTPDDPTPEPIEYADIPSYLFKGNYGDAQLARLLLNSKCIFDPAHGHWHIFDHHNLKPGHWAADPSDDGAAAMLMVQELLSQHYTHALDYFKDHQDEAEAAFHNLAQEPQAANKARKKANRFEILTDALNTRVQSLYQVSYARKILANLKPMVMIRGNEWDADPMKLGVANGTIDLRTGQLIPTSPSHYIRRTAPTAYDPQATAPRFTRFIHEIHGEHVQAEYAPVTDFMHRMLGYAITGLATEHIYPIMWGFEGRNGKDTLLDALHLVLGSELAKPASKDTIITSGKRNTGSATPELYDLWGARIVWVNETEDSDRIKAAQLKELSGGSIIKCRPLHGNLVEFKPTHLGLLITNHKPHAPADDQALWERLVLIPYTQRFVSEPRKENEHKADKMLGATLKSESEGILNWLVQGCVRWRDEGLTIPDVLRDHTKSYRSELDTVGEWFEAHVIEATNSVTRSKDAYQSYKSWAESEGYYPVSHRRFTQAMLGRGIRSVKDTAGIRGRGFDGIMLRDGIYS